MLKCKTNIVCRSDGEALTREFTMTALAALAYVARGVEVGNHSDFSGCVPFTKYMGAEHRRINTWSFECEGSEKEIFPLFVAAYCIQYIICKGNECSEAVPCLRGLSSETMRVIQTKSPTAFRILEKQDAKVLCLSRAKMINFVMMIASGITDKEDIGTGLELSEETYFLGDNVAAAIELVRETPGAKLRDIIAAVF